MQLPEFSNQFTNGIDSVGILLQVTVVYESDERVKVIYVTGTQSDDTDELDAIDKHVTFMSPEYYRTINRYIGIAYSWNISVERIMSAIKTLTSDSVKY